MEFAGSWQRGDEGNDVGAGDAVNVELRGKGCINYWRLVNRREGREQRRQEKK